MMDEAVAILERTPPILDALLRTLPQAWIHVHEGDTTWSPFEVVGHLILGERTNWMPRARIILDRGASQVFDEFKRYPKFAHADQRTLPSLLDEFAAARTDSLQLLRQIQPADLDRQGQHPALGVVTLRQLLSAWVVHDLDHLSQISRVLAHQYTDEVGPWRQYLRIVRDPAH